MARKEEQFVLECIQLVNKKPDLCGQVLEPPISSPSPCVLFWDPLKAGTTGILKCPLHHFELTSTEQWSWGSKLYYSRLLFHLGRNCHLIYKCPDCKSLFKGHDDRISEQLEEKLHLPFLLFHRNGLTRLTFNFILAQVQNGSRFNQIHSLMENMSQETIATVCTYEKRSETDHFATEMAKRETFAIPSCHFISDVFLMDFYSKKELYGDHFRAVEAETLSLDHTFKLR